jgi:hypothetical protein
MDQAANRRGSRHTSTRHQSVAEAKLRHAQPQSKESRINAVVNTHALAGRVLVLPLALVSASAWAAERLRRQFVCRHGWWLQPSPAIFRAAPGRR